MKKKITEFYGYDFYMKKLAEYNKPPRSVDDHAIQIAPNEVMEILWRQRGGWGYRIYRTESPGVSEDELRELMRPKLWHLDVPFFSDESPPWEMARIANQNGVQLHFYAVDKDLKPLDEEYLMLREAHHEQDDRPEGR